MLDRKALLILPIFILVTLAGAIWQVTYMAGGMAPFVIPVSLAFSAATLAYQARRVTASAEALAAWKKWGSFFLISCAAILTAFQLQPIIRHLRIPCHLPRQCFVCWSRVTAWSLSCREIWRPNCRRWSGGDGLGCRWERQEMPRCRALGRWLLVSFGLITIASALLLPLPLISPLMGVLALVMLVAILAKWRQLLSQRGSVRSEP